MPTTQRIPSYRHHKPSNQAVVRIDGKDHYLGRYGTAKSRECYQRLVAEWLTSHHRSRRDGAHGPAVRELTINELILAFMRHACRHYVNSGTQTSEIYCLRSALRPLKRLYGAEFCRIFGPLSLKGVRQEMINVGWSRKTINLHISRVRHVFKWGVENELVAPEVYQGLQAVAGLRRGRSSARETDPVKPVPEAFIDAVLPHVSSPVAVMIRLQLVTGMRPGEVVLMRGCDLEPGGKVWLYRPESHKTAHHGHQRVIALGPQAQAILKPFLKSDMTAFLFSPRDAVEEQ